MLAVLVADEQRLQKLEPAVVAGSAEAAIKGKTAGNDRLVQ